MSIYNCKVDGDNYQITKFTPDLEVESSYLTDHSTCQCPAGHRHTCRHRQMLPMFEAKGREALRGGWFLDFDRKVWIRALGEGDYQESTVIMPALASAASEVTGPEPQAEPSAHAFTMLDLAAPLPHIPNDPTPNPELGNHPKPFLRRI